MLLFNCFFRNPVLPPWRHIIYLIKSRLLSLFMYSKKKNKLSKAIVLHWFQLVSAKYLNNSKPANSLQFGSPVWVVVEWNDSLNAGIWDWVFRLAIGCVSGLRRSSLMFILRGSITVYYSSDTFCNLDFFTVKNRWIYFRRWSDILRETDSYTVEILMVR